MSILVDDSAETVQPVYGEALDLVGFKGLWPDSQGCRGGKRSVSSVPVVMPLVLAQRVPEVGLVPDQRAVQQFGAQCLDLAFGDRVDARHPDTGQHRGDLCGTDDLVDRRGVLGVVVADEEPDPREASGVLRSISRLRIACVTQAWLGCAVVPRMRTRRPAWWRAARMY